MEKKKRPGLKLSDIDILRELIGSKTIQEVANKMEIERTLIYRVLRQAELYIGMEKGQWDWRKQGVPPEIFRIVQSVNKNVNSEKQYPIISIGTSLSLFLMLFSHANNLQLPQLKHLRSSEIADGLKTMTIDIAYAHRLNEDVPEEKPWMSRVDLVPWNCVVVFPRQFHSGGVGGQTLDDIPSISWAADSFADKLTMASQITNYKPQKANTTTEPIRYSESLELIRRGYFAKTVVPDIFLSKQDRSLLQIMQPPKKVVGYFSALFRANEADRINHWIDPGSWNKVFSTDR